MERPNVAVFGDSILKGIVLVNNKYVKSETNIISLLDATQELNIKNYSVFGQTLKRVFDKKILELYLQQSQCLNEFIVIELGGNDSDFDWNIVTETPTISHNEKTPIDEFYQLLSSATKMIKSHGKIPVLCTLPPVYSKNYFKTLSEKYDGEKILKFFDGDISNIYRHQEAYNNEIVRCASENGCLLLDLRSELLMKIDYHKFMCEDGIHPNDDGYKLIYESIIKQLKEIKNENCNIL